MKIEQLCHSLNSFLKAPVHLGKNIDPQSELPEIDSISIEENGAYIVFHPLFQSSAIKVLRKGPNYISQYINESPVLTLGQEDELKISNGTRKVRYFMTGPQFCQGILDGGVKIKPGEKLSITQLALYSIQNRCEIGYIDIFEQLLGPASNSILHVTSTPKAVDSIGFSIRENKQTLSFTNNIDSTFEIFGTPLSNNYTYDKFAALLGEKKRMIVLPNYTLAIQDIPPSLIPTKQQVEDTINCPSNQIPKASIPVCLLIQNLFQRPDSLCEIVCSSNQAPLFQNVSYTLGSDQIIITFGKQVHIQPKKLFSDIA